MRTLMFVAALVLATGLPSIPNAGAQDAGDRTCRQVSPGHLECGEMRIVGELPPLRRDLAREVRRSVRRRPF